MICLALGCGPAVEQSAPEGAAAEPEARPAPVAPRSPAGEAIEYTLRFPAPETHYLEVEAIYPTGGEPQVELLMAVWTPGSYLVREFARHIEGLAATTLEGAPLVSEKVRKNRFRVTTGGADRVVVRYRLYAREASVRTNYVDATIASLNGAPTFLTLDGGLERAHDVKLDIPEAWTETVTSLPRHADGQPHHYVASDFDELVDSPIVAGTPELHSMTVAGVEHVLANFGGEGVWDEERSARDVEAIVRVQTELWGEVPYDRYIFLNLLLETGGGLEHRGSTALIASRWATRDEDDYRRWLSLVSHEFFHTWNVKRLRPVELGPFDYESEIYTRGLWVAEGITSYYDDLLVLRAGLMDEDEYLEALSDQIERVQRAPGTEVQSLAMASFDTWIKFYRPDENSRNTRISYYRKGAVVAFLLDARIRRVSGGMKTLDDVMRLAYERYSGEQGFTSEQFRAVCSEVAGADLTQLFVDYVDSTVPLDFDEALSVYGLRFEEPSEDEHPDAVLGVQTRVDHGRLIFTRVDRGGAAHRAGLNVGDELLAFGDERVPPEGLSDRLERYRPEEQVEVLIARRGRLVRLPLTFGGPPADTWDLEVREDSTVSQRLARESWLGTAASTPSTSH